MPNRTDWRSILRNLRANPWFALAAVWLLGAGIAAAAVTFTFANALLLKPLPVRDPESLVRAVLLRPRLGPRSNFVPAFPELLAREGGSFAAVGASYEFSTGFTSGGRTDRVVAAAVSPEYLTTFGVVPAAGGFPAAAEAVPVLLSHRYWRQRFGGQADALGQKATLRGVPCVVAGVLPPGFQGATVEYGPDVRIPQAALPRLFPTEPLDRWSAFEVVARLKPGVALAAAQAEAYAVYARASDPRDPPMPASSFALQPLTFGVSRLREQAGPAAAFAFGAAALLALMVCANLSGLLLARVLGRRRELIVRSALGASRARLVTLVLAETALLALGGGVCGALLTAAGTRWAAAHLPPVRLLDNNPAALALDLAPDWRIALFTLALGAAAFALVGVAPAWRAANTDPNVLREGGGAHRTRAWRWLVAIQMGVCTALLGAALAAGATLANLRTLDPGLARGRVVSFTVDRDLTQTGDDERFRREMNDWRDRVAALPGVESAALGRVRLLRGSGRKTTLSPEGGIVSAADFMNTSTQETGPEYFATLGQRLLEGRLFTAAEYAPEPAGREPEIRPVIVNLAFARRFDNGDPMVGRRFGYGVTRVVGASLVVVGVVTDAKYRSPREPMQPTVYWPLAADMTTVTLVVRTAAPAQLMEPVRAELRAVSPTLVAEDVSTLEQDIETTLWMERALGGLSRAFAAIAALVAGAGLGALLVFLVASRKRELAVRVAVGAAPRDLVRLVLAESLWPVFAGLVGGAVGGWALLRGAESVLYGVSARDPFVAGGAAAAIAVLALLASLAPAWQAARVDAMSALREH